MKKLIIIFSVFNAVYNSLYTQLACPSANFGRTTTVCNCDTFTFSGVDIGSSEVYRLDTIPYSPQLYTGTSVLVKIDDWYTNIITLPFNFCFFGKVYDKLIAGSNGMVCFDLFYANRSNNWSTNGMFIPNPSLYPNSIYGPYHDIDPKVGGQMYVDVKGTAPCRRFVVSWVDVPLYSSACNSLLSTHQIVLYETTNIIEVYIANKPVCSTWNGGVAHLGIQNHNATLGYAFPGKNGTVWTSTNQGYRFTPNGASRLQYNWTLNGNPISNNKTAKVCSKTKNGLVNLNVTYTNCDGSTLSLNNSDINLNVSYNPEDSFEHSTANCRLKIKYKIPCSSSFNSDICVIKNQFQSFDFYIGLSPFPNQINDFTLKRIDTIYNFDCKKNYKEYNIVYNNATKGDLIVKISVDCSCTPPDCPPPTKVNPYLNNLAGNWQSQNSYAYNTKRVVDANHPTKNGQYFENYNPIMNYNGSYWSMDDRENWISKETNTIIDFNGQSIESSNPLHIPSSAKLSFNNTLTNHVVSNAASQETFFLSNEDEAMFKMAGINRAIGNRDKFDVNEIELPLKPNVSTEWPFISNHWHKEIDLVEQSKEEFHTGTNSLKVKPKSGSESYAYTQYFTCESQYQNNHGGVTYCLSEPTNAAGLDITKVSIGTINNISNCNSLFGSQGNAKGKGGAYADYTASVPLGKLNKGSAYNLTVDFNKCSNTIDAFCHAYFDWNQDGDFADNNESYWIKNQLMNNTTSMATATKSIAIPSTALVGKTRMRIVYQRGVVGANTNFPLSFIPCAYKLFNSVGETEDYTIQVLDKYEPEAPKETYTVNPTDVRINSKSIVNEFSLQKDKDYLLSYWVKDNLTSTTTGYIDILDNSEAKIIPVYPSRPTHIEGWHKVEKVFRVTNNKFKMIFFPTPNTTQATYFDDIRIQPVDASMKGYVYDERTQRLVSELDENNYATFYDYDEEGQLIRVRKETERGIMTIKESRKTLKQ